MTKHTNPDTYEYWAAKLRGEDPERPAPADIGKLPLGFWRLRTKDNSALAVWMEAGERVAQQMDGPAGRSFHLKPDRMAAIAEQGGFGKAVTEAGYRAYAAGEQWPDMDKTVAKQIAAPSVGHNQPPTDPLELLREQITAAKAGADDYAKIAGDEQMMKAQGLRSRLLELSGEADKRRDELKRPHFEAGKAIDAAWQPLVKDAKAAADAIRSAMNAYETEKLRAEREERRKHEEATAAAARANQPPPEPPPVPMHPCRSSPPTAAPRAPRW